MRKKGNGVAKGDTPEKLARRPEDKFLGIWGDIRAVKEGDPETIIIILGKTTTNN